MLSVLPLRRPAHDTNYVATRKARLMRLCFVADPASIHTQRWVGYCAAAGHKVHLVNLGPQPAQQFDWPGPQHHTLPEPLTLAIPGARGLVNLFARRHALRALLAEIRPDVLHAHYIADPGWFAALSGFHPLVLTAWGSDLLVGLRQGPWLNRWLTRYALRRADLLTADARQLLDVAQPHLRPGARTELIRFGVDTRDFSPGSDATWRVRLNLGHAPLMISIRQCHPLYNIDIIIRAFARVRETLPTVRLVVKLVSQGVNNPYLAQTRALVSRLALDDVVIFVPQVAYTEMPDLYRSANVVVSVPSSDGMPVSVLEAMACGAPVVASDLPALRELTADGADLSLVPVRDAEALSRAVLTLLTDPVRRQQAVDRNLATVRRTADFAVEMARMEQLYRSLALDGAEGRRNA